MLLIYSQNFKFLTSLEIITKVAHFIVFTQYSVGKTQLVSLHTESKIDIYLWDKLRKIYCYHYVATVIV